MFGGLFRSSFEVETSSYTTSHMMMNVVSMYLEKHVLTEFLSGNLTPNFLCLHVEGAYYHVGAVGIQSQ